MSYFIDCTKDKIVNYSIQKFFQLEAGAGYPFREIIDNLSDEEITDTIMNWAINHIDMINEYKEKAKEI